MRLTPFSLVSAFVAVLISGLVVAVEAKAQYWTYTVRPGDNLWNISERYLANMGFWQPLQELNGVTKPREIPPGSTLKMPVRWLKRQPASVTVVHVAGEAMAIDGLTGVTSQLEPGTSLQAADEIQTAPQSSVILEFADGSRFIVQENSRLMFDRVSVYGSSGMVDTRLRLHEGRLDVRTAPREGAGSRFEVWTPAAVSAVRGTQYRVAMKPGSNIGLTEVVQGEVQVAGGGRIENVPGGFGTVTERGKPPSPPVPLLDPPDFSALPDVVDRVPIGFALPALSGAVAYRLQIAPDAEFRVLLFDRKYPQPRFAGPDLPDGSYVLRVRGIDDQGLEGKDAIHSFELDARPEPPVLMTPDDGSTVREPVPSFRWTEPQEARAYHFQLAANGDFLAASIELKEFAATSFTSEVDLDPGSYEWRVATIDAAGEHGPFSDPQSFVLRPAPPSPTIDEPTVDETVMVFRWRAGSSGHRYQVQLATDRSFQTIVADETVDEPRLELPRPHPGPHYLRVRTIDVDGFRGPFGSPQKFDVPPTSYWPYVVVPLMLLVLLL